MCLCSHCQQLFVATAIAKGHHIPEIYIGHHLPQASHFLRTVAVGGEESAGESALLHLYLRTYDRQPATGFDVGGTVQRQQMVEEWFHPTIYTGAHHYHVFALPPHLLDKIHPCRPQQMQVGMGKTAAISIEISLGHALEKMRENPLFGFPVGIKPQQHEQQPRGMKQEPPQKSRQTCHMADESQ